MAFTPVEIIALVLSIAIIVKLVFVFAAPKGYLNFAKSIWKYKIVMTLVYLALGGLIGYYLLQELTIVQIMATTALVACLIGIGFTPHVDMLLKVMGKKFTVTQMIKDHWLYILIWLAAAGWVLYALFA